MEPNPFLRDMPWVTVVTQVRAVGNDLVETPQSDCVRIWGRVQLGSGEDNDIQKTATRIFPHSDGLDRQQPYSVVTGVPPSGT